MTEAVLVIDDEQPTLDMFALFLEAFGYTPLTALTGEEGLGLFDAHQPSLVMTDIKMPGMDGIEVLQAVKKRSPATEVIVITGHGDMELALRALECDAADFINKPLGREALETALERCKERRACSREQEQNIEVQTLGATVVVTVRGHVTSETEPFLRQALDRAVSSKGEAVVLHFPASVSVNGGGLAALESVLREYPQLRVVCLSENFQEVFRRLGLHELAPLYGDLESAVGVGA